MDLQLPSSKDEIEAIQSRRKRVAFQRAKRAPFLRRQARRHRSRPARRSRRVGEDPDYRQGNPAGDPARHVRGPDGRLRPSGYRGILALGRRDGRSDLLPADGGRHALQLPPARALLGLRGRRTGRSLPHVVPLRRASGGAAVVPHRQRRGHRHRVGGRRQHDPLGNPARSPVPAAADAVDGHARATVSTSPTSQKPGASTSRAGRCASCWSARKRCRRPSGRSSSACGGWTRCATCSA